MWEGLLTEVATAAKAPDAKLLCLGRPGIGKRTLLQALHQHACPLAVQTEASASQEGGHSRAVGLDFAHFGARDPELEEAKQGQDFNCSAACSVLILEDVVHERLLLSRLKPSALQLCAAIICLDLKTPWTMLEDLRSWLEVLKRVVGELMQQLPLEEQDRLREQVSDELAAYAEPSGKSANTEVAQGEESQESAAKDGAGGVASLTYNFGMPVIVVVTRADTASALESPKTAGWSEIIETFLRNECLPYGSAIVYTAVGGAQSKSTRNVDVLYEYLMHRLYGHALKSAPNVPSRDSLFVPGGWDSRDRVDKTASSLEHGLERSFESSVVSLEPAPPAPPPAVQYEDMQKFLKSSAAVLQKLGAVSARSDKAKASLAAATGAGAKKATEITAAGSGKRASIDASAKGGIGKEDKASVANFFQNLLTRGQSGAALGADKRPSSASTAGGTAAAKAAAPAAAGAADAGGAEEAKLAPPSPGGEFPGVTLKVDSEKPEASAPTPETADAAAPANA
ncbi:DYNC1LI1 [Symbiodinium sp. CCMP2456]|nr:DYNC1LI1 [Symbiodinium sp. CCMP2456]